MNLYAKTNLWNQMDEPINDDEEGLVDEETSSDSENPGEDDDLETADGDEG